MHDQVMVSVAMLTYNHAPYIREAIESVLMQKVSFPYELVIADDCSTDGTREIIREYQEKHPDIVKPLLQPKNIGARANNVFLLKNLSGKYVAALEGDDYWIDANKLQGQVDFLETHPAYTGVCTNVYRKIQATGEMLIDHRLNQSGDEDITFLDIHENHPRIYTPTFTFRQSAFTLVDWINDFVAGDIVIFSSCALQGPIRYFSKTTTVYRALPQSASSENNKNVINLWENHVVLLERLDEYSNGKYQRQLNRIKEKYITFVKILKSKTVWERTKAGVKYYLLFTDRGIREFKNVLLLLWPSLRRRT